MKLFRTLFGDRIERLEEKGDELRLNGYWREASWFYRQALEALPPGPAPLRDRLAAREAETRGLAFRQMLEDAEERAGRGRSAEVLEILRQAEAFAGSDEEREMVAARRAGIEGRPTHAAAPGATPPGGAERSEEEARFRQRLSSRPEAERKRLAGLGRAGRAGYLALLDGDFAAAATALQREVLERPEAAAGRELLARAFEGLGHHEEARQQYEAACRRSPERCRLAMEVSRVLRDGLGDGARALARVEEACQGSPPAPASLSLHMERVFLLAETGRFAEAIRVLDDLLACPGLDRGLLLYNRAGLLQEAGRYEEAVSDVAAAIEAAPANPLYLERMADLLFGLGGDLPRALQLLDGALAIDANDFVARKGGPGVSPDRARLQFKAGRVLCRLNRPEEALTRVDEALVVCWDPLVEEALLDLRRSLTAQEAQ